MKNKAAVLLLVWFLFQLSACATLFKGTTNEIMITSEPANATVRTKATGVIGTTPTHMEVRSSKDVQLSIEKEGYKTAYVELEANWDWAMMIIDIPLYLVPFFVDLATGAIWQHKEKMVSVHLEPAAPASHQWLHREKSPRAPKHPRAWPTFTVCPTEAKGAVNLRSAR